jgi:phage repressor protein C with HTH and peptisase S24 domain
VRGAFPADEGDTLSISDLEAGDWFAVIPQDDAMDRIAPAGSIVLFNRTERALDDGGLYLFSDGKSAFMRRYRAGDTGKLLPLSINPEHLAIPFSRDQHTVIGRCRRSILEL